MNGLRAVTAIDEQRAEVLALWRNRFSTATTRRTMWSALISVTRTIHRLPRNAPADPASVEWEVFADLLAFEWLLRLLHDTVAPATATKYRAAVTSLLRYLAACGFADAAALEATLMATRRTARVRRADRPPTIATNELGALLHACREDPSRTTGLRDAALIAVAAGTGARRAEVISLSLRDIDIATRVVHYPTTKGGGGRTTIVATRAMPDLTAWLDLYDPGPDSCLFPALRKGGVITEDAMSAHQFWKRVRHRSDEAGITRAVSPHDLRRWYVTALLDGGSDIFTVMRTVGHRHPSTTQVYDRRPIERLREVIDSLAV